MPDEQNPTASVPPTPAPTTPPTETPPAETPPSTLLTDEPAKPAEGDPAKPVDGDKPPAPATFDAKALTLPEGITLSDEDVGRLTPLAEKHKLSTEAVSDLLAVYGDRVKQLAAEPMKAWTDLNTSWINEVKADPTLGNGQGLRPEVKTAISKVKAEYGDAAFNDALNVTGAGNNPAVIRFLHKISKVLVEGGHVGGRPAASGPTGPSAEAMYPEGPRTTPALKAG
jgi:hypothetical protein